MGFEIISLFEGYFLMTVFDAISFHFEVFQFKSYYFFKNSYFFFFTATREKLLGLGHMGIPSSEIGPVFWGALIIIIAFGGVVCMFTSCRTRTKKARIMREQTLSSQPESIR